MSIRLSFCETDATFRWLIMISAFALTLGVGNRSVSAYETGFLASFRWTKQPIADARRNDLCGFLFLNGKYVNADDFARILDQQFGTGTQPRSSNSDANVPTKLWVEEQLAMGNVVILYPPESVTRLVGEREGLSLLHILANRGSRLSLDVSPPDTLASQTDRTSWQRLVADFQTTAAFVDRATEHLQIIEAVQQSNQQIISANLWINRLAYPLTIFSMIFVVLGFGHLLSNKPIVESVGGASQPQHDSRANDVVVRSLAIFSVLSVVDLAWTISAAQSGTMRELNPIGSTLVNSPQQLICFKLLLTAVTVTLLYRFREHRFAQAASWWSCLVLTLLTARWLTFNSILI